jgi:hypothetical protein
VQSNVRPLLITGKIQWNSRGEAHFTRLGAIHLSE